MKHQTFITLYFSDLTAEFQEITSRPTGLNFCNSFIDIIKDAFRELMKEANKGHPRGIGILVENFICQDAFKTHFGEGESISERIKFTKREILMELSLIVNDVFGVDIFETRIDFDLGFIFLDSKNPIA